MQQYRERHKSIILQKEDSEKVVSIVAGKKHNHIISWIISLFSTISTPARVPKNTIRTDTSSSINISLLSSSVLHLPYFLDTPRPTSHGTRHGTPVFASLGSDAPGTFSWPIGPELRQDCGGDRRRRTNGDLSGSAERAYSQRGE